MCCSVFHAHKRCAGKFIWLHDFILNLLVEDYSIARLAIAGLLTYSAKIISLVFSWTVEREVISQQHPKECRDHLPFRVREHRQTDGFVPH